MLRCAAALFCVPYLCAQFTGISASTDGSALYFVSALRLKGAAGPLNGKVFVEGPSGVQLFRERAPVGVPSNQKACTAAGFADYIAAETSATGTVALHYKANAGGLCSYPVNTVRTEIVTASGTMDLPGVVRLSPAGRYAIGFLGVTARPTDAVGISVLDVQTGAQTPIAIPAVSFPQYIQIPLGGGRVIADDGTALVPVASLAQNLPAAGYVVRPDGGVQPFPVANALPLAIDASGSKVLYRAPALSLLDLKTQTSSLLVAAELAPASATMSDDARRVVFLGAGQVHTIDTASVTERVLTSDPAGIAQATISGDGKVVYAVTGAGGLLKINADDGSQVSLIRRTPYLAPARTNLTPGVTALFPGSGMSDSVINGTVPLAPALGGVTLSIGGRGAPIVQVAPNGLAFLTPWDLAGPAELVAAVPGDNTPFDYPDVPVVVNAAVPEAGPLRRQDWSQTYVGPVNTGEVIHVWALGFGAVSPDVPFGAAAPMAEPFARLANPLTCSNADVLYAGLAPGAVERVYQIDLRIGAIAGYQKFTCSLGGGQPFIFLTLNVTAP